MLNLLHDIGRAANRIPHLRARIAELTAELHAEEMKVAILSQQCVGILELEILEEQARKKGPQ